MCAFGHERPAVRECGGLNVGANPLSMSTGKREQNSSVQRGNAVVSAQFTTTARYPRSVKCVSGVARLPFSNGEGVRRRRRLPVILERRYTVRQHATVRSSTASAMCSSSPRRGGGSPQRGVGRPAQSCPEGASPPGCLSGGGRHVEAGTQHRQRVGTPTSAWRSPVQSHTGGSVWQQAN